MSENQKGQNQSAGGANRTIIIIGAVIIVLLVGIILVLLFKKPDSEKSQPQDDESQQMQQTTQQTQQTPKREVLASDENISELAEQLETATKEYVKPGRYTAMMNFEWHFATGDSESSDSYVANSDKNTNDVYFDVFLDSDKDNAIYESPIIPRGSEIKNIKLKRDLDAGTYDCILVYHLVDENQNSLSTASFTVKVIIEG
jgi:predicted metalloprotease